MIAKRAAVTAVLRANICLANQVQNYYELSVLQSSRENYLFREVVIEGRFTQRFSLSNNRSKYLGHPFSVDIICQDVLLVLEY